MGPDENVGFWVLHCKEANNDKKPCSATKYRDSIDLLSLARFLHVIDVQPMVSESVLRGCVDWLCGTVSVLRGCVDWLCGTVLVLRGCVGWLCGTVLVLRGCVVWLCETVLVL